MIRKLVLLSIAIVLVAIVAVVYVIVPRVAFREGEVKKRLEAATASSVQVGHFRQVYFPRPGYVIDDLLLTPSDPRHPVIKAQKFEVYGSFTGVFGKVKRLGALHVEGAQVLVPANADDKSKDVQFPAASESDVAFDEITAKNSQIVIAGEGEPQVYDIHHLELHNYAPGEKLHFKSELHLPEPPAEVEISGDFGPYSGSVLREVPLSGKFSMKHADLSKFHALTGIVDAEGKFEGKMGALQVNASTNSPEFGLTDTGKVIPLKTEFSALLDATSGNLSFQPVHALLGQTKITAEGHLVSDGKTPGKTLTLDLSSDEARIQDLMYLFVQAKPPLQGSTRFHGKVRLPDNKRSFTERVEFTAQFGIRGSKFTDAETQKKVGGLSESARGNPKEEDPTPVVTDLVGDVALKNGIANFSQLSLHVPGAAADLHGTYKLESHAVDLHGTLQTDVKLSQATTGFKAFLMKVVEAAKAKKKEGATVPVKITGTYDKPEFGLDAVSEK